MDKKKWLNAALALLPLIAVVLAGMPDAVTAYAVVDGDSITTYCSFFALLEDVPGAVCMPFAGICGAVTFGLAVIYLVKQTTFWLKGIVGFSFASMTLAVVPILTRTEVYLIPNMLVPILMLVVCLLAYGMLRKPAQEEKKHQGKLLKN